MNTSPRCSSPDLPDVSALLELALQPQPPIEPTVSVSEASLHRAHPEAPSPGQSPQSTAEPSVDEAIPHVPGYYLLGPLGHGGMGAVWRALQLSTRREVALKCARTGSLSDHERTRFAWEIETTARLDHPRIGKLFDARVLDNGLRVYAMELVRGQPMHQWLRYHPLDRTGRLALMHEIVDAVAFAHGQGLIHRDLKPANIMIDECGHPKVIDFGLAKRIETGDSPTGAARLVATDAATDMSREGGMAAAAWSTETPKANADSAGITCAGELLGTPAYMAPEQAAGEPVTAATDVYALGVMLYELLLGRRPFAASTVEGLLQQLRRCDAPAPRTVDRSTDETLDAVVAKSLQRDPAKRYRTAGELAEDLRRYLAHEPVMARSLHWPQRVELWVRRQPAIASLLATLIAGTLLSVLLLSLVFVQVSHQRDMALEYSAAIQAQLSAAQAAKREAQQEADIANEVSGFLLSLFEGADSRHGPRGDVTLREALDAGAEVLRRSNMEDPATETALRRALSEAYRSIGLPVAALDARSEASP